MARPATDELLDSDPLKKAREAIERWPPAGHRKKDAPPRGAWEAVEAADLAQLRDVLAQWNIRDVDARPKASNARPQAQQKTLLMSACEFGRVWIIEYLLSKGASISKKAWKSNEDHSDFNALDFARWGFDECWFPEPQKAIYDEICRIISSNDRSQLGRGEPAAGSGFWPSSGRRRRSSRRSSRSRSERRGNRRSRSRSRRRRSRSERRTTSSSRHQRSRSRNRNRRRSRSSSRRSSPSPRRSYPPRGAPKREPSPTPPPRPPSFSRMRGSGRSESRRRTRRYDSRGSGRSESRRRTRRYDSPVETPPRNWTRRYDSPARRTLPKLEPPAGRGRSVDPRPLPPLGRRFRYPSTTKSAAVADGASDYMDLAAPFKSEHPASAVVKLVDLGRGVTEDDVIEFAQRWNREEAELKAQIFSAYSGQSLAIHAFVEMGSVQDAQHMIEVLHDRAIELGGRVTKADFSTRKSLEGPTNVLKLVSLAETVKEEDIHDMMKHLMGYVRTLDVTTVHGYPRTGYVEFESAQFAAGAKQFVHKNNLAIHGKSLKPFFKRADTTPPAKDEHRKR